MKTYNKILATALAGVLLVGCNDLDTEPQGSTVTSDQKSEVASIDPSKAFASVSGLHATMNQFASVLGSDYHNDIGWPGMFIYFDQRGADMYSIITGFNWYQQAMAYTGSTPKSVETYYVWSQCYNLIRSANGVLSTVMPAIDPQATDEATMLNKFYAAQAFASHALAYETLAQAYQFTYVGHETAPSVPIITYENADQVATEGAPRASLEDVYQTILSDLTTAIEFMTGNPNKPETVLSTGAKRFASLAVAYGLRARANLLKGKWSDAASDAQAAISNFSGSPLSQAEASVPGFNDINAHNWMYGIDVAETDDVVTTGICNFPSHMGSFSYGYASAVGAWKWINNKLYATISSSDVRKNWWLNENGTSAGLTAEQQAFLDNAEASPYVQVKFAPYNGELNTNVNASDIPLMRVEEMYLILAEAQAMTAPATGLQTLVDFVKTYRDSNYNPQLTTSEEVRNEVWRQRRIELWGEGFSFFDLLRLNKGVDRRGGGWNVTCNYNIAADDPVLIYPIPESEVTTNKQISESDNNKGGSRPDPVIE